MNQLHTNLLNATRLLDFDDKSIQALIKPKGWNTVSERDRIKAVYDFVKNDIIFGYDRYLTQLQTRFNNCKGTFCGYGVYTDNFCESLNGLE